MDVLDCSISAAIEKKQLEHKIKEGSVLASKLEQIYTRTERKVRELETQLEDKNSLLHQAAEAGQHLATENDQLRRANDELKQREAQSRLEQKTAKRRFCQEERKLPRMAQPNMMHRQSSTPKTFNEMNSIFSTRETEYFRRGRSCSDNREDTSDMSRSCSTQQHMSVGRSLVARGSMLQVRRPRSADTGDGDELYEVLQHNEELSELVKSLEIEKLELQKQLDQITSLLSAKELKDLSSNAYEERLREFFVNCALDGEEQPSKRDLITMCTEDNQFAQLIGLPDRLKLASASYEDFEQWFSTLNIHGNGLVSWAEFLAWVDEKRLEKRFEESANNVKRRGQLLMRSVIDQIKIDMLKHEIDSGKHAVFNLESQLNEFTEKHDKAKQELVNLRTRLGVSQIESEQRKTALREATDALEAERQNASQAKEQVRHYKELYDEESRKRGEVLSQNCWKDTMGAEEFSNNQIFDSADPTVIDGEHSQSMIENHPRRQKKKLVTHNLASQLTIDVLGCESEDDDNDGGKDSDTTVRIVELEAALAAEQQSKREQAGELQADLDAAKAEAAEAKKSGEEEAIRLCSEAAHATQKATADLDKLRADLELARAEAAETKKFGEEALGRLFSEAEEASKKATTKADELHAELDAARKAKQSAEEVGKILFGEAEEISKKAAADVDMRQAELAYVRSEMAETQKCGEEKANMLRGEAEEAFMIATSNANTLQAELDAARTEANQAETSREEETTRLRGEAYAVSKKAASEAEILQVQLNVSRTEIAEAKICGGEEMQRLRGKIQEVTDEATNDMSKLQSELDTARAEIEEATKFGEEEAQRLRGEFEEASQTGTSAACKLHEELAAARTETAEAQKLAEEETKRLHGKVEEASKKAISDAGGWRVELEIARAEIAVAKKTGEEEATRLRGELLEISEKAASYVKDAQVEQDIARAETANAKILGEEEVMRLRGEADEVSLKVNSEMQKMQLELTAATAETAEVKWSGEEEAKRLHCNTEEFSKKAAIEMARLLAELDAAKAEIAEARRFQEEEAVRLRRETDEASRKVASEVGVMQAELGAAKAERVEREAALLKQLERHNRAVESEKEVTAELRSIAEATEEKYAKHLQEVTDAAVLQTNASSEECATIVEERGNASETAVGEGGTSRSSCYSDQRYYHQGDLPPPQLLHVRRAGHKTDVFEVPLTRDSMTHGDAFILADGKTIYTWMGDHSSPFERTTCAMHAENLARERHGNVEQADARFWHLLGGEGPVKYSEE